MPMLRKSEIQPNSSSSHVPPCNFLCIEYHIKADIEGRKHYSCKTSPKNL
uniref:Uncharacterized protein n=1 Tax=Rhizophora mucronata TaxID=61149 RepID=A0A2P2QJ06_RHIMU